MQQRPSKWTAFGLSLIAPGSGQLLAGSVSGLAWLVAAAFLTIMISLNIDSHSAWNYCLQSSLWLVFCLASAWHARGLLEMQPPWPNSVCTKPTVACEVHRKRRVSASLCIPTSLSSTELWNRIRQLEAFLTIDPFHERITLMRKEPAAGVDIVLHHNAFGCKFDRFGRILYWHEGIEFAISDLAAGDPRQGFPHVFHYRIEKDGDKSSLTIRIRGRWTSRAIPIWLGRLWIAFVCRYHGMLLSHAL